MPRWLSNPGTFGYGKPVFIRAYDSSPVLAQNIAEARKLVKQAGATGKTLTIGTTSQLAVYAGDTRRLAGGGTGDRAQGRPQVRTGPGLHQLLLPPRPGRASTASRR